MNTDTFTWYGDDSQPTSLVTNIDLPRIESGANKALVHWPGTDPAAAVVIVDDKTVGTLPRPIAAQMFQALKALRIYANPIQVGLVIDADGAPALDLPLKAMQYYTKPAIKPTSHGANPIAGWPEEMPIASHPMISPDPLPIRTRNDFIGALIMRTVSYGCLGALLSILGMLALYILGSIFR